LGILLLQSLSGSQPRWRSRNLHHPGAKLVSGELGDLDVAENGPDQRAVAIACVGAGLPIVVEEGKIFVHGVADSDRAMLAVGAVGALDHGFAGRLLCLPEGQHGLAISIGDIVSNANFPNFIGLLADVVSGDPRAGLSITEAAVAQ